MRAIAAYVAKCDAEADSAVLLAAAHDMSSFSFIQKRAIREVCTFLARTTLPRLRVGERETLVHSTYRAHAILWSDTLGVMLITDEDYPPRVAFKCISDITDRFREDVETSEWKAATLDNSIGFKESLRHVLSTYTDPTEFDSLTMTNRKLEATRSLMETNIQTLLRHNEDLETLMKQSDDVSDQSKQMFETSKKVRKGCCRMQ
eukprot:Lankesteria_metandrocarpae@DN4296_c0_g1_i1.p2